MLISCHVACASLTDYPKSKPCGCCVMWSGEVERVAVHALCEYVSNYYGAMARARTEDNVMRSYRQRQQDNSISASCTASPGSHNANHPPTHTHTFTQALLNFLLWLCVCVCVWSRANKRWLAARLTLLGAAYPLSVLRLTASMCACLCTFGCSDVCVCLCVWVWEWVWRGCRTMDELLPQRMWLMLWAIIVDNNISDSNCTNNNKNINNNKN